MLPYTVVKRLAHFGEISPGSFDFDSIRAIADVGKRIQVSRALKLAIVSIVDHLNLCSEWIKKKNAAPTVPILLKIMQKDVCLGLHYCDVSVEIFGTKAFQVCTLILVFLYKDQLVERFVFNLNCTFSRTAHEAR